MNLKPLRRSATIHGHCHQKSFGQIGYVEQALGRISGLEFSVLDAGCCGMAGAFGYGRDTYEMSVKMGELELFPAIRSAADETLLIADGSSCRHQIELGTGRKALHVSRVLHSQL